MAFKHGRSTAVWYGQYDMGAYLNTASLQGSGDTADTTTFSNVGWKTSIAGTLSASVSMGGFADADFTALDSILGSGGGVLTYCPAGALAIGDRARLVSVITSALVRSAPVGGVVALGWDVQADSAVGIGDVLHILSKDTNTTTGASKDDAAATTTGWIAHVHVTSVDGGSWVIKLQDSADSSSWSDVTGAAFTAATGATAERLVSASGATLRRYVRYVATRTGGSAGQGITFALAYARNA